MEGARTDGAAPQRATGAINARLTPVSTGGNQPMSFRNREGR